MGNARFLGLYITISVLAFVISKITIAILMYRRWQRKHLVMQQSTISGGKLVLFRSPNIKSIKSDIFLKKTMKLTSKDRIGSGGYGTVYRLTINDSTSFAVKKLSKETTEQDRGFERELEAMGDIKHRNIVTLHGYYTAPNYNLLIYELMPNGGLDTLLHGRTMEKVKTVVQDKKEDYVLDNRLEDYPKDEIDQ
ncbi:Protein kinase, ATP binding site-containing protein, partial [Cynara cardunculus var. scolymus]